MSSYNRMIQALSFETVVSRMKADLKNPPNRVEGSFASDNIQAVAKEILKYYDYVNFLQDQHYAETAEGEFLDKKAGEVGVFRKKATKATGFVTFVGTANTYIPKGFVVSSDFASFVTKDNALIGNDGTALVEIEAIEPGINSNEFERAIYKFENTVIGIREVYNIKPITGGTEIEDDENLRERTLLRMRYPGTSGNQYHYMHWAMEVDGVGRVRVFPVWDGPGTVKVSILDSNQRIASEELIRKVKYHIDHDGDRLGESLAPIGALLTVSTAKSVNLSVVGKVILEPASKIDLKDLSKELRAKVQEYIDRSIAYKNNRITVAKVIDILYSIEGVLDIIELTVNGKNDSIGFGKEEIPYVESVSLS